MIIKKISEAWYATGPDELDADDWKGRFQAIKPKVEASLREQYSDFKEFSTKHIRKGNQHFMCYILTLERGTYEKLYGYLEHEGLMINFITRRIIEEICKDLKSVVDNETNESKQRKAKKPISEELDENSMKKLRRLGNQYVPGKGIADTVGGEILRAYNRLWYRFNNDGDVFYSGYGIVTAGGAAAFLYDTISSEARDKIESVAEYHPTGSQYRKALDFIGMEVLDYLTEHDELFQTPNEEDSYNYDTEGIDEYFDKDEEDDYDYDDDWDDPKNDPSNYNSDGTYTGDPNDYSDVDPDDFDENGEWKDASVYESYMESEEYTDDWDYKKKAEYITDNFKTITGRDLLDLFNKRSKDSTEPLFNQDMIESTAPAIKEALMDKFNMDERDADRFLEEFDSYLINTFAYSNMSPTLEKYDDFHFNIDINESYKVVDKNGRKVVQGGGFESRKEAQSFADQYGEDGLRVVRVND